MLQSIHDKLKGWLAGVVLGAIGLVFVFWGINWTLSAPTYAAKVNGSEMSANEVRQSYQQQLAQAERQSNGSVSDAQRNDIKMRVLDDYVNSEALVTRADKLGYRVTDQQLLQAMAQIPIFQVDGKFDYAHAVAVLRAQGRSIPEIEALVQARCQAAAARFGPVAFELRDRHRNEGNPRADQAAARARLADPAGGEIRQPGDSRRCGPEDLLRRAQVRST